MKGMPGMMIAAGLGVVGALCNWFYVQNQARNYETVSFVAIAPDAGINSGDRFREEHFVKVDVPRKFVGMLESVAVQWKVLKTVVGVRATRQHRDGELLLQSSLETPAQRDLSEKLSDDEVLFQVVVDSSTFISEHYNPDDEVQFFVPQYLEAVAAPNGPSQPSPVVGSTRTVGPFRILALGTRKGTREVATAYDRRPVRENVITIALKFPFDQQAEALFRLIGAGGSRGLRIIKHKGGNKAD